MKYRLCLFAKSRLSLCEVSNIDDSECGAHFYLYQRFRIRASFYFRSHDSVIFASSFIKLPNLIPCLQRTRLMKDVREIHWGRNLQQVGLNNHSDVIQSKPASNRAIGPRKNSISRNRFEHSPSCRRV